MITVYPEVISNIQWYLLSTITLFKYTKARKKILPMAMLEYLVNHNSSDTDIKMEVIADIKFQIHILHLEEFFIQEIDT